MTRSEPIPDNSPLPAGDFSNWLEKARSALVNNTGTEVECGDCTGCCSSAYFIHILPEETQTLKSIEKDLLAPAPGLPKGHRVLPYDQNGLCPMLKSKQCSIYKNRPRTCRNYDCRVFAAAGILAGEEDKSQINKRIEQWSFSYPFAKDKQEHRAVKATAQFIQSHADSFPQGRIPSTPSQLAILAIKTYPVFLDPRNQSLKKPTAARAKEIANAIVKESQGFDSQKPQGF